VSDEAAAAVAQSPTISERDGRRVQDFVRRQRLKARPMKTQFNGKLAVSGDGRAAYMKIRGAARRVYQSPDGQVIVVQKPTKAERKRAKRTKRITSAVR
jgi:hypothetical protein